MPTQLERARKIVADFIPQDPPSNHYVYLYLGKATYDATQYQLIDGLCLASKRIWHLDEAQADCVAYVGEGCNGRIQDQQRHSFVPINSECRIKLYEGASKADAQELERLLIAELGCLLDNDRPDGCLANIRYFHKGPHCCRKLEAFSYKAAANGIATGGNAAAAAAAAAATSIETYAITAEKKIIATGSMAELARQLGVSSSSISQCCLGKRSGIWSRKVGHAIYFCKAEDYETFRLKTMTTKQYSRNRIMIAAKLDGSDICCGNAPEIGEYAPEIMHSSHLHNVARGEKPSTYGWTARYADEVADELKAPVATCGPNLSGFF